MKCRYFGLIVATFSVLLSAPQLALAHPGHVHVGDFHAGWQHPLTGLDHLLAMVAVGLLAVRVGGRGVWLVPIAFLLAMLGGAGAAALGMPMPGVELGITASVVVLGVLIASASTAPLPFAMGLAALFAFFHGHAHATEMVSSGSFTNYASGFLLATAGLLGAGVLSGFALTKLRQSVALRVAGGAIAALGAFLIVGWI